MNTQHMRQTWITYALLVLMAGLLTIFAGCSGPGATDEATGLTPPGSSTDSQQGSGPRSEHAGGAGDTPGEAPGRAGGKDAAASGSGAEGAASGSSAGNGTEAGQRSVAMGQVTAMRLIDRQSGWVGGKGWIARTDDGGKSWSVQFTNERSSAIKQLFALNGQQAWAVLADDGNGDGDLLLATTDGGRQWEPVGRMPSDAFLHFVSEKEGFAAHARTTDGGRSWTQLNVPDGIVGDAYFHDANNGWAVLNGENRFFIQRTKDGGNTWTTVMERSTVVPVNGAVIRSAGRDDAWVELIGDSGMSQTGYSLFHTMDGGANWIPVLHNKTAGAGPGPGFSLEEPEGPSLGMGPGPLQAVSPTVAYVGGFCAACDSPNSVGWTTDGGKTFTASKAEFPGYAGAYLMMADTRYGWWICTDAVKPSILYTTSDGGVTWQQTHTFDTPNPES